MNPIEVLLARCRELGVSLIPTERGTLKLRGTAPLPDDLRQALNSHKGEILILLAREEPTALSARLSPERLADLDLEEQLFRLYWSTLPDEALARRMWPAEMEWYCGKKKLPRQIAKGLEERCRDLREG